MADPEPPPFEPSSARTARGEHAINACWKCGAALVRPDAEGQHAVTCPRCRAAHMVVVIGDRMVVAGLTVDARNAAARTVVKIVAFVAVVGAIVWALATWMQRGS